MPRKKTKTSGYAIQDIVNLWTSTTNAEKIKREVDRWTKRRRIREELAIA